MDDREPCHHHPASPPNTRAHPTCHKSFQGRIKQRPCNVPSLNPPLMLRPKCQKVAPCRYAEGVDGNLHSKCICTCIHQEAVNSKYQLFSRGEHVSQFLQSARKSLQFLPKFCAQTLFSYFCPLLTARSNDSCGRGKYRQPHRTGQRRKRRCARVFLYNFR